MISEVEFARIYQDQPLFGDVCNYLSGQKIAFHKFLNLAPCALKRYDMDRYGNPMSSLLWADALFVCEVNSLPTLPSDKMLKLAVIAFLYGSSDLVQVCLAEHDRQTGNRTEDAYLKLLDRLIPADTAAES